MGAVAGQGLTYNLPNYVGELFRLTPTDTPFLAMIGGLSGGVGTTSKQFTWQTTDNNAPGQPEVLEGANPVFESRDRAEVINTTQIFQYGVELSYTKQAAVGNLDGQAIVGTQPVQNEASFQLQLKIERAARDVDFSFLNGAYQLPANNSTGRKTRGVVTATTTNSVNASSTALSKTHIDNLIRSMVDNGAPLRNVVVLVQSFNKQRFSNVYGYAPESRTVGGVNIQQVLTDFAPLGIVYERQLPASTVQLVDVSVCKPRFLTIPGKGHFFTEPLAKTGASDKWQLYGEIGLEYGPENWHGKVINTTTS
jgi:hypothetical protein